MAHKLNCDWSNKNVGDLNHEQFIFIIDKVIDEYNETYPQKQLNKASILQTMSNDPQMNGQSFTTHKYKLFAPNIMKTGPALKFHKKVANFDLKKLNNVSRSNVTLYASGKLQLSNKGSSTKPSVRVQSSASYTDDNDLRLEEYMLRRSFDKYNTMNQWISDSEYNNLQIERKYDDDINTFIDRWESIMHHEDTEDTLNDIDTVQHYDIHMEEKCEDHEKCPAVKKIKILSEYYMNWVYYQRCFADNKITDDIQTMHCHQMAQFIKDVLLDTIMRRFIHDIVQQCLDSDIRLRRLKEMIINKNNSLHVWLCILPINENAAYYFERKLRSLDEKTFNKKYANTNGEKRYIGQLISGFVLKDITTNIIENDIDGAKMCKFSENEFIDHVLLYTETQHIISENIGRDVWKRYIQKGVVSKSIYARSIVDFMLGELNYSYTKLVNDFIHILKHFKKSRTFFEYFRCHKLFTYKLEGSFHYEPSLSLSTIYHPINLFNNMTHEGFLCRFGANCVLNRRNRRNRREVGSRMAHEQYYGVCIDTHESMQRILFVQKLDAIHDYLYHSQYAQSIAKKEEFNLKHINASSTTLDGDNDSESDEKDELNAIEVSISTQQQHPHHHHDINNTMRNNSKFVTTITSSQSKRPSYSFGFGFRYKECNKHHPYYIKPKYNELKREILKNDIYAISENEWKLMIMNASRCFECDESRKMSARAYRGENMRYNIPTGSSLRIAHIKAMLLYTNQNELQREMKKTMRAQYSNESRASVMKRNQNYAHWCALLYELCAFFSTASAIDSVYYHGISEKMMFDRFFCNIAMIISTSKCISQACHFQGANGILLTLQSNDSSRSVSELDLSILSDFPEEEEFLFFETTLAISNIQLGKKMLKGWIDVFSLYDHITHGGYISILPKYQRNKQKQRRLKDLLNDTMNNYDRFILTNFNEDDKYIHDLFEYYCAHNTSLWINFEELQNECGADLVSLFLNKSQSNKDDLGRWIKYLKRKHRAQIQNLYLFEWNPSSYKINQLFSKRNKLCHITGLPLTCECVIDDNKTIDISFKPYLLSSNKGEFHARFGLRLAEVTPPIRNVKIAYNMNIDSIAFHNHFAPIFMSMNRDLDGGLKEYGQKVFSYEERRRMKRSKCNNISLALMIPEIQNESKKSVPIRIQLDDLAESISYNIKTETSINNDWILNISYLYAFLNSVVYCIDIASDYYVLWILRYYFEWNEYDNVLLWIWCLMFIDLFSCQIMYCYQFASKHFNSKVLSTARGHLLQWVYCRRVLMFVFGIILLFIVSPLLPFLEAMPYLYYRFDFVLFLDAIGVPIVKKLSSSVSNGRIVKLSSETDEVRYWLRQYIKDNTLIFRQIAYESSIQLILQSIAFIILFKQVQSTNALYMNIVSIFITLATISSKLLVYSYSIHKWCIVFNFFCWICDMTHVYCIIVMLSYLIIFETSSTLWKYYVAALSVELFVCLMNYTVCILARNPYKLWASIPRFPFGVTGKWMVKFAHFPENIFFQIESGDKTLQYQYYHDIIQWINNWDNKEYKSDYNLRLAIANYYITQQYISKTGEKHEDDAFVEWILSCDEDKNLLMRGKQSKYHKLLDIKPRDIRKHAQIGWKKLLDSLTRNPFVSFKARLNYDFHQRKYDDWNILSYYLCHSDKHKYGLIIKYSNITYLICQALYVWFPFFFFFKPGITLNTSDFALLPTIFLIFYCFILLIIAILACLKVYHIQYTSYHLVPMKKGFYYRWSSNVVGKMKGIRHYLIHNIVKQKVKLKKHDYGPESLRSETISATPFNDEDDDVEGLQI